MHVGALRALEQQRVAIAGFAGTSAGAIVAALAAAGVSSVEMIGPASGKTIIDELHVHEASITKLTDLFGPGGWVRIRAMRDAYDSLRKVPAAVPILVGVGMVTLSIGVTAFAGVAGGFPAAMIVLMAWVFVLGAVVCFLVFLVEGLARVETFRNALATLLRVRLFGSADGRDALMSDFDGVERPLLKIVASDISHRKLQLFSCDTELAATPVADAVAASICLPLIFTPWRIGTSRFVDGGVVSNFPAWPFDEERALDGDAMTIGFQIGEPLDENGQPNDDPAPSPWPIAVIQTALFGSGQLSTRAVGRAELITLRPKLKLLGFDITGQAARNEVDDMTTAALIAINDRLFKIPGVYRDACALVRDAVEANLRQAPPGVLAQAGAVGRLRCAVAMAPEGFKHCLSTRYGVGYETDADSDLLWPINGSLAGLAWEEKEPRFELRPLRSPLELGGPTHVALRRRLPSDLAWSFRIPILSEAGSPLLIVLVDGSGALQDTTMTLEFFEALADQIEQTFHPVARQLKEPASHGDDSE